VRDPEVDDLIEKVIAAKNRAELFTACRALDRVLLWSHYVIPHWNSAAIALPIGIGSGNPPPRRKMASTLSVVVVRCGQSGEAKKIGFTV
jgi:microcin C transport system substrate-binding protein